MSFASEIKQRLCSVQLEPCCARAETAAAVSCAALAKSGEIKIKTEISSVADRILANLSFILKKDEIKCQQSANGLFIIKIPPSSLKTLSDKIGGELLEGGFAPSEELFKKKCCREAFLRGAFLASGSMSDPNKSYHLEFVTQNARAADIVCQLLSDMDIAAKITVRKNSFVVYIKDSESIASLLGIMGAGSQMMEIYNIKIEREIRNNTNRLTNCDTANIDKTTAAAQRQIKAIQHIKKTIGFENIPETLSEIALLRLENPEASLKELGQMLSSPIGKSGVNHRLERICKIAQKL